MRRKEDFTDAYGRREKPEPDAEGNFDRFRKKSYERYFEGYTVEKYIGPGGKVTKYRVYTGDLFRPELDGSARRRLKLTYGLCLCASLLLSISALILPAPSNSNIIAFSFACIPIALYIRLLFAFGAYAAAGSELKMHEYNDGAKVLARFSRPALISAAAAIVVSAAVMIIKRSALSPAELARMVMLAVSGILAESVGRREKQVRYEIISGSERA